MLNKLHCSLTCMPLPNAVPLTLPTAMLHPGQILDMTPIGMIFRVVKSSEQTAGQSLEMEWELAPQTDSSPVHVHPKASETFRVLQGQIEVSIHDEWHLLHQGEEITIPAGTPHTFRNPTDYSTRVHSTHAPAMQFENYFEELCRLVNKLAGEKQEKLHMNFNAVIYLCMLMKKYPDEIRSVNPPNFVVTLLNYLGKARRMEV